MEPNRYYKATGLSDLKFILKQSLGWHMVRIGFLIDFVIAILQVRTVNMSEIAVAMPGDAKMESRYKRLQRFMKLHLIDFQIYSKFLSRLIPTDEKIWLLTLDRTNWKFGKSDINILMLAVAYKGAAFPLMWEILPKRGNSNTDERIALMNRFVEAFGTERIRCLTADREFIGFKWFNWLKEKEYSILHSHKRKFLRLFETWTQSEDKRSF